MHTAGKPCPRHKDLGGGRVASRSDSYLMEGRQPAPGPGWSAKRLRCLMLLGWWPSQGLAQEIQPLASVLQGAVLVACPSPLQARTEWISFD